MFVTASLSNVTAQTLTYYHRPNATWIPTPAAPTGCPMLISRESNNTLMASIVGMGTPANFTVQFPNTTYYGKNASTPTIVGQNYTFTTDGFSVGVCVHNESNPLRIRRTPFETIKRSRCERKEMLAM